MSKIICIVFVGFKLPPPTAGSIKSREHFPIACVSQIVLKFIFVNMHACKNNVDFH